MVGGRAVENSRVPDTWKTTNLKTWKTMNLKHEKILQKKLQKCSCNDTDISDKCNHLFDQERHINNKYFSLPKIEDLRRMGDVNAKDF